MVPPLIRQRCGLPSTLCPGHGRSTPGNADGLEAEHSQAATADATRSNPFTERCMTDVNPTSPGPSVPSRSVAAVQRGTSGSRKPP